MSSRTGAGTRRRPVVLAAARLRKCPECGSRPDHRDTCPRCEAVVGACRSCGGSRFEPLGLASVGLSRNSTGWWGKKSGGGSRQTGDGRTERDLITVPPVDLAVVVDADGLVRGTNYRATEDALSILARVASTVHQRGGRWVMLQTADRRHPVYAALRRADPFPFLEDELVARRRFSYLLAAR